MTDIWTWKSTKNIIGWKDFGCVYEVNQWMRNYKYIMAQAHSVTWTTRVKTAFNQSQVSLSCQSSLSSRPEVTRHSVSASVWTSFITLLINGSFFFRHCDCGLFRFVISLLCIHEKVSCLFWQFCCPLVSCGAAITVFTMWRCEFVSLC